MITTLVLDASRYRIPLLVAGALVAAVLVWLAIRRMPSGTPWFYYLASLGGLAVSLNTSWRFFGQRLGITGAERVIMFSVVELALIACALGMRANVRRPDVMTGRPGPAGAPRLVAWALCGLSAYAALLLSGPIEGIARVALGPTLSLVMLHLALGIELRNHTTARTSTWGRVTAELRERALSRLGVADDNRDARTRTRERAALRAARLAITPRAPFRTTRLARALRAADVAHDPLMRERMLAELAVLRHATDLRTLPQTSPWTTTPRPPAKHSPVLDPPASDETYTGGVLDSVVLAANTPPPWPADLSKKDAVDRADALLPGRTPRALVAALSQVGVTVAESTIRRRRTQRAAEPSHEHSPAR
jgi:hypothetical protein